MSAILTWSCSACGLVSEVDLLESCALGSNVPLTPPEGWRMDGDGEVYCPGRYCQQAYEVAVGEVPEMAGDTRDSL